VFKFKLIAVEEDAPDETRESPQVKPQHRLIPTSVKLEVWKRDLQKCTKCGSRVDLHFDHIIPFSRGGSSTTAENIQLLCGRHNLEKHDQIE
jgi:5-methylcytosine-specific restriction endonuclease McrA